VRPLVSDDDMGKFPFTNADVENVELARQIVLERLRTDKSYDYIDQGVGTYDHIVDFDSAQLRVALLNLVRQVLWELLCQGVLTPGTDSNNPDLPRFRITPHGREVLEASGPVPYDPTGYVAGVRARAQTCIREVALSYLAHAVDAFNKQSFVATTLLLGVSAEAAFLDLLDVIRTNLKNPNDAHKIPGRPDRISPQHAWVMARFDSIPRADKAALPESVAMNLRSLLTLIRLERNELGHPQLAPPAVTREQAYLYLSLYPALVTDIELFAEFCRNRGL
jgi:hypothetical protein